MSNRFGILLGFLFLATLQGCATTIKDFSQTSLLEDEEKEGVLIGHFDVEYNDVVRNSQCAVCFSGSGSGCYKLPKSGNILMRVTAGETKLTRISCLDSVEYHIFPKDFSFKTLPQQKNYIGDVTVHWKNPRTGFQWDKFFNLMGAIPDEKHEDGSATLEFRDKMDDVFSQISPLLKQEDALPINVCEIGRAE